MNPLAILFFLVIGPIAALLIGCIGVDIIEETVLGWPLLIFGAGYPPGAIIYYLARLRRRRI